MDSYTKKIITNLTAESVSVLTKQFAETDGAETQVGSNHRCAYDNSESGRALLVANEPEDLVEEVFSVWGNKPTVEEPKFEAYAAEPTTDDIINAMLGLEG